MLQFLLVCGIALPQWVDSLPIHGSIKASPLAALFLVFCTWITTRGSETAEKFNNVVTSGKLAILLFILTVSFANFEIRNFKPMLIQDKGIAGVIEGATILFFGYLGFDFITTIAEEAKDPKRDVPQAIKISVIVSMCIYVFISFGVSGVGRMASIEGDGETALAQIFSDVGCEWMTVIIFVCAIMGITAAAMTNLMSQSRILYSYAKDGLFFKVFKELDPDIKVPVKGGWISIIPICFCAFFMNLTQLAKLCSLCNLMTYSFIDAAVIALRLKQSKEPGLN